jgi:hypothetical protein
LTLTADHGICPLPEVARASGLDAGRIDPSMLTQQAEKFLGQTFGSNGSQGKWFASAAYPAVYLNQAYLRERQLDPCSVEEALCGWFVQQPGILAAYSRTQLLQRSVPADDAIGRRVLRSFYPDRSGDLVVIQKPYYLFMPSFSSGTTHGTPHSYDTHVPLLVDGPGIPQGPQVEAVTPQAVAAIVSRALGIAPPAKAEAPLPRCLLAPNGALSKPGG